MWCFFRIPETDIFRRHCLQISGNARGEKYDDINKRKVCAAGAGRSGGTFLGELGNPLRFEDARQMSRLAGYNLIEDSSGKNKSGTCISKRGRKNLRSVLYQISLTMVANNKEMRQLYDYLKTRENNLLKKMQALVVVSKKVLTLIFTLSKKKAYYEPELVFGSYRKSQLQAA